MPVIYSIFPCPEEKGSGACAVVRAVVITVGATTSAWQELDADPCVNIGITWMQEISSWMMLPTGRPDALL